MNRLRAAFVALLTGAALAGGYLAWYWWRPLHPGDATYVLRPGAGPGALGRELEARGVLHEARSFVLVASLPRRGGSLKAGEYRFADGISAAQLLDQVIAGRVIEYTLRLGEGWTFRQSLQTLAQAPKLVQTLAGLTSDQIMARLGYPGQHPEGRFFPDTYKYTANQTDLAILARAYERMQNTLQQEWEARSANLPFKDPYEALTLASIVEKETGQPDERPMIAAVFVNRLRRNMKLQTDPTVIYGLGEKFDGDLRLRDLRSDTAYNTYTRIGLPPTPIALPGAAAIRAVMHPAETRALYFVSRGDGSHVFSETLAQHNDAVIKYQLGGKPRSFSSHPAKP
jgi:UPF0755 protein